MAKKKTPTKKTSTAKSKTKKTLDSIDQTHGKAEDAPSKDPVQSAVDKARELDRILGMRKISPFGTASLEVFEENLSEMNLTDMREVAVKAGIFPNGNRTVLKKKLIKGFVSHNKGVNNAASNVPLNNKAKMPDSSLQQQINDIWAGK